MYIFIIIAAAISIIIAYMPELMPNCFCCGFYKPRPFFRLHKVINASPCYNGNISVCRKCCRKYGAEEIEKIKNVKAIKKRLKMKDLLH